MFVTAISHDGTIVAVVPKTVGSTNGSSGGIMEGNQSSTSSSKNIRLSIPLYQIDSSCKYHLQTTLATTIKGNFVIKKIFFGKNTNYLCVYIQQQSISDNNIDGKIIVFDILRGVYVQTIAGPTTDKKKSSSSNNNYQILDVCTAGSTTSSEYLYMLCINKENNDNSNKVLVYQTSIVTGKTTHKLKCGKIDNRRQDQQIHDDGSTFAVYNDDIVAVLLSDSNKIKVYKLKTGDNIGKCKLSSSSTPTDHNKKIIFSNDGKLVGLLLQTASSNNLDVFQIDEKDNITAHCGNIFLTKGSSNDSNGGEGCIRHNSHGNVYIIKKSDKTYTIVSYDESSSNHNEGMVLDFELSSSPSSSVAIDADALQSGSAKKKKKRKSSSSSAQHSITLQQKQKRKITVSSKQSDYVQLTSIVAAEADINITSAAENANIVTVLHDVRQQQTYPQRVSITSSTGSNSIIVSVPSSFGDSNKIDDDDKADKDVVDKDQGNSNKRKLSSGTGQVQILGPGQDGGEMLGVTDYDPDIGSSNKKKRKKQNDDDDDAGGKGSEVDSSSDDDDSDDEDNMEQQPSIAERLERLAQEMDNDDDDEEEDDDEEKEDKMDTEPTDETATAVAGAMIKSNSTGRNIGSNKVTSTESLLYLLKQALKSNDNTMLELALTVRDKKVIGQTINEILFNNNNETLEHDDEEGKSSAAEEASFLISSLITQLTARLASKPNRASELALWLSVILQQTYGNHNHNNYANRRSNGALKKLKQYDLRPLHNLLDDRIETFPHLLKLDGRLSLL